jgi:hypothetical protein
MARKQSLANDMTIFNGPLKNRLGWTWLDFSLMIRENSRLSLVDRRLNSRLEGLDLHRFGNPTPLTEEAGCQLAVLHVFGNNPLSVPSKPAAALLWVSLSREHTNQDTDFILQRRHIMRLNLTIPSLFPPRARYLPIG